MMRRTTASLVALLIVGGLVRAENLVSGPQVGEKVPSEFRVTFLNGTHAGEKGFPVSTKEKGPVALLFANDVSDPLTALLKRLDDKPAVYVVLPSDDSGLKKRLKGLVAKEQFKNVVVCCGPVDGLAKWEIADESVLTVVLLKDEGVKANFAFRKDEFSKDWADAIVKAAADLLPLKKNAGD